MERVQLLRNVHSHEELLKEFEKGGILGRGASGVVLQVKDRSNDQPIAAMKVVNFHLDRSVLMGLKGKEEKSVIEVRQLKHK